MLTDSIAEIERDIASFTQHLKESPDPSDIPPPSVFSSNRDYILWFRGFSNAVLRRECFGPNPAQTSAILVSRPQHDPDALVSLAQHVLPGPSPHHYMLWCSRFDHHDQLWCKKCAKPQYIDVRFGRMKIRDAIGVRQNILDRLSVSVHAYLAQTEQKLVYGDHFGSLYQQNVRFVADALSKIAPDALIQFNIACERAGEGEPESRSHALTSCRRVLKSVADALYPARRVPVLCPDGITRQLTDDRYINRLLQFVSECSGHSKSRDSIEAELHGFGTRLDGIQSVASKGVHSDVDELEMSQCVMMTFMLVGDLWRLARSQ